MSAGLLVWHKTFWAWAHYRDDKEEITALAPLTGVEIENLVPHLGIIGLVETQSDDTVSESDNLRFRHFELTRSWIPDRLAFRRR